MREMQHTVNERFRLPEGGCLTCQSATLNPKPYTLNSHECGVCGLSILQPETLVLHGCRRCATPSCASPTPPPSSRTPPCIGEPPLQSARYASRGAWQVRTSAGPDALCIHCWGLLL